MAGAELSSEGLRAQLYHSMQRKGILDTLKSQLRSNLARELKQSFPLSAHPSPSRGSSTLWVQAVNNLIADHLQRMGYEYSLSTFSPEASVNVDKLYSAEDFLQLVGLPLTHPLHHQLQDSDTSILLTLLRQLSAILTVPTTSKVDEAVQTEDNDNNQSSFASQLKALEESYAQQAATVSTHHHQSVEERMAAYQHQCDARSRRQLEVEMHHFREKELTLLRMEEKVKHQRELSQLRDELEHSYQLKLMAAQKEIEEEKERMRKREKEMETSLFDQRQSLLEEMSGLKAREEELQRQVEINRRSAQLEEERVQSLQHIMADKEKAVVELRAHYEQIAASRLERCKIQLEAELSARYQQLAQWEARLTSELQNISNIQSHYEQIEKEMVGEKEKVKLLERQLNEATSKQADLVKEKEEVQGELALRGDYIELKKSVVDLKEKIDEGENILRKTQFDLEEKIADQQRIIDGLKGKLNKPSSEQIALQEQLQQLVKQAQREVLVLQHDDRRLRKELSNKEEGLLLLQQEHDEQAIHLRSALREIEDLQGQVDSLQLVLLSDLKSGGPGKGDHSDRTKLRTASHSKSHSSPRHKRPSNRTSRTSAVRSQPQLTTTSTHIHSPPPPLAGNSHSFPDTTAELLSEARAAFARIEREAGEYERFGFKELQSSNAVPPLATSLPPLATSVPPLATSLPPLATSVPPLATSLPPLATSLPPTTAVPVTSVALAGPPSLSLLSTMEQPSSYPLSVSALAPPPPSHSTVVTVSSAEPITSIACSSVGGQRPADTVDRIGLEREGSAGSKERDNGGGRRQTEEKINSSKLVDLPTRTNMVTHITTMPISASTIVTSTSETSTTAASTSPESIESSPLPAPNTRPLLLDHLWKSVNKDEGRSSSDSDGRREHDDEQWEREREQKIAVRKEREKEENERVKRELQILQRDASPSSKQETSSTVQSTTKDRAQPSPENSGTRHHSDSQIDPVMLKYMEIVKQKRQEQPNQHRAPPSASTPDLSLVRQSESLEVLSVGGETDPFEDW